MNAHDFVGGKFNLRDIKEIVESELEIKEENNEELDEEGIYVLDIVSGSYGQYQQKAIAEFFNIELDDDGIADQNEFIDNVAEEITSALGLKGNFYFGYLEADSTFGLFYNE